MNRRDYIQDYFRRFQDYEIKDANSFIFYIRKISKKSAIQYTFTNDTSVEFCILKDDVIVFTSKVINITDYNTNQLDNLFADIRSFYNDILRFK